jgi:hypothetical protein
LLIVGSPRIDGFEPEPVSQSLAGGIGMRTVCIGIGSGFLLIALGLMQSAPAQPAGLDRAIQKVPDQALSKLLMARQKGKGKQKGQMHQKGGKGKGKGQMKMQKKGGKGKGQMHMQQKGGKGKGKGKGAR